jgi:hypothetical protein
MGMYRDYYISEPKDKYGRKMVLRKVKGIRVLKKEFPGLHLFCVKDKYGGYSVHEAITGGRISKSYFSFNAAVMLARDKIKEVIKYGNGVDHHIEEWLERLKDGQKKLLKSNLRN